LVLDEPLRDIVEYPEVSYSRLSLFGPETFTLKVIRLGEIREARIGERVKVNIRGTDFEVKPFEILEWLERFGTIIGDHRYILSDFISLYQTNSFVVVWGANIHIACQLGLSLSLLTVLVVSKKPKIDCCLFFLEKLPLGCCLVILTNSSYLYCVFISFFLNSSYFFKNFRVLKNSAGKNTDGIEVCLILKEFLPEWLPIQGKKLRLYHHGIKVQCNGCFGIGHQK